MRSFDYTKLTNKTWDNEILSYVAKIHEYKGKQESVICHKSIELSRLVQIAKIQSTEASNSIEGIITTNARLKQLIEDKTTPINRDESEILGYRNVLNLVHENYLSIPLKPSILLQLHRDLLKYTSHSYAGCFKSTSNEIDSIKPNGEKQIIFKPLEPFETAEAVKMICESFNETLKKELVDPLILIPCFILDFLCIHPFTDGNGRMSRLITLLLLYQSGYKVGQYISIEKAISDTKNSYYNALKESDIEWHENKNNSEPFIKYMLAIILSCYKDFEDRLSIAKQNKSSLEIVRQYATVKIGTFTKQNVLENCPSLASSSVESALKKLVEDGTLVRLGRGKNTCYVQKIK